MQFNGDVFILGCWLVIKPPALWRAVIVRRDGEQDWLVAVTLRVSVDDKFLGESSDPGVIHELRLSGSESGAKRKVEALARDLVSGRHVIAGIRFTLLEGGRVEWVDAHTRDGKVFLDKLTQVDGVNSLRVTIDSPQKEGRTQRGGEGEKTS